MAENTALQLLQNGYIFALIEQYNFVKKACNNIFEYRVVQGFHYSFHVSVVFFFIFFYFLIIFYQKLSKTEKMRVSDFPCIVMMNLFFGKLLLGIKLQQFTLQAKENNLILTE